MQMLKLHVWLMCHTSRLAMDDHNFESNQGVVNESKIADWKAV
jgi:hypothetical protein